MIEFKGVKIYWLGHAGFKIKNRLTIYVDPYKIEPGETGDLILITHDHYDHLSIEDISKISSEETIVIATKHCEGKLSGKFKFRIVGPGDMLEVKGVKVEAIPAYNVKPDRLGFHPRGKGYVGYIIELDRVRIYHAGDTDFIPEMKNINVDVALLPVSGTYVMDYKEAVEAAKAVKPELAIPMHYGTIVGGLGDAERFKGAVEKEGIRVEILEKEKP